MSEQIKKTSFGDFIIGQPGTGKAFRWSAKDMENHLEYCKKNNIPVKVIDIDKEFDETQENNPYDFPYSKEMSLTDERKP